MSLDQAKFRALRADLDATFKQVAERHGFKSITLGKIGVEYNGAWRAKIEGVPVGGMTETECNYDLTRRYHERALPELGATFTARGIVYTIIGQASRGNRRVEGRRADGRVFLFPVEGFAKQFPFKKESQT